MFVVHVTCSDQDCAEEIEAVVDSLEEIDDVVCECGCGTVLVSVAEEQTGATVVELRFDRHERLAA
jgi:hypothetical protein